MPRLFKEHSSVCSKLFGGSLTFPWPLLTEIVLKPALDFPDGPVVENLLANAGGSVGSLVQEFPHAKEQLSLCSTTTQPVL